VERFSGPLHYPIELISADEELLLSRPLLGAVQHTDDLDDLALHPVYDYVRQCRDHEFARASHTPLAPDPRLFLQESDLALNPLAHFQGGGRAVLRYVILDPVKVAICSAGPLNFHLLPNQAVRFAAATRFSRATRRLAQ